VGAITTLAKKFKRTENIKLCSKVFSVGRICYNLCYAAWYAMFLCFSRRGHETTSCPIYFDVNEKQVITSHASNDRYTDK